ncbi:MAG: metallophosphoesterase family protein, partial [Oscillospiraceae bacterium]|nr:metallophosphoesterase family protein [Oscillospiraceae bacterium]
MKRILIFSDTHGFTDDCINIINSSDRVSSVIHAGDCVRDAEDLEYVFPNIPIHYVKGNNDFYTSAPSELTVT